MPEPRPTDTIMIDTLGTSEKKIELIIEGLKKLGVDVHINTFYGLQKHYEFAAPPAVGDLDNGQIGFANDGGTRKGFVRLSGVLYEWDLTAT